MCQLERNKKIKANIKVNIKCNITYKRKHKITNRRQREKVFLLSLYSIQVFRKLGEAHSDWGVQSNVNITQDLSQTHSEVMFNQVSGHPMAQSSGRIKLTITQFTSSQTL